MLEVKKLQHERKKLFEDLYDGKIPKRVPISANLPLEFCIQSAGLTQAETQWAFDGLEKAMDIACQMTYSDYYPLGFRRPQVHLQLLGAGNFTTGSNGLLQHPEAMGIEAKEYDEFIRNPYDCIMEKVLPRIYSRLNTDPVTRSIIFAKAFKAFYDYMEVYERLDEKLINKYGFHSIPNESFRIVTTPFDFVADFLRGFKGIAADVKRHPLKIKEACEAILPIQIKRGIPPVPSKYGQTLIPLHMGTYLRPSDFEKLYWPTLYKMVYALANAGQPCCLYLEHDWTKYLDYLHGLPEGTRLWFECGDPMLVKKKLGKKHIISGFYPLAYLNSANKTECIDKAKELIDILAPGGKYYFEFDSVPQSLEGVNLENYKTVLEYVAENANYSNSGVSEATEENVVKEIADIEVPEIKSKYYRTWQGFRSDNAEIDSNFLNIMEARMQGYEELLFNMMSILM